MTTHQALYAALRKVAIVTQDKMGNVHTLKCKLCGKMWDAKGPEQHAVGCEAK